MTGTKTGTMTIIETETMTVTGTMTRTMTGTMTGSGCFLCALHAGGFATGLKKLDIFEPARVVEKTLVAAVDASRI